jgi:hypothetical protein
MSLEQAVKQCTKPGDVIICFEEHFMPGFFKKTRLAEKLASTITLPVYTLSGTVTEKSDLFSARLLDYGLLVFCLVTLVGFFAFEVWIDQSSIGAIRTILQIMAIFVEVWIVAACSKRFY